MEGRKTRRMKIKSPNQMFWQAIKWSFWFNVVELFLLLVLMPLCLFVIPVNLWLNLRLIYLVSFFFSGVLSSSFCFLSRVWLVQASVISFYLTLINESQ